MPPTPSPFHLLSLGALAAERDNHLSQYFIESQSYYNLINHKKLVLLGNRGAGKTAIFKMIANSERKRGSIVIELTPEDYSYELLSSTLAKEGEGSWAKNAAFAAAWKYLLYVLAMKKLAGATRGFKGGSANKIYSYIRDNHKSSDINPIGILVSWLKRLEGIKIGPYEAGTKSRELQSLYKLEEINYLLHL